MLDIVKFGNSCCVFDLRPSIRFPYAHNPRNASRDQFETHIRHLVKVSFDLG